MAFAIAVAMSFFARSIARTVALRGRRRGGVKWEKPHKDIARK